MTVYTKRTSSDPILRQLDPNHGLMSRSAILQPPAIPVTRFSYSRTCCTRRQYHTPRYATQNDNLVNDNLVRLPGCCTIQQTANCSCNDSDMAPSKTLHAVLLLENSYAKYRLLLNKT